MDESFELYTSLESMLWFEDGPHHVVNQSSAFQRYTNQPFEGLAFNPNVNKKMIEFLKKSSSVAPPLQIETIEREKDRIFKHRITERMRRQKLKQIYLDLHKLLPLGTKSDSKSILETAAKEIEELKQYKEVLKGQNREMELILSEGKNEKSVEKAEIKLEVSNSASGVDSMLEVLRCLNITGCTATALQSNFSQHGYAAAIEFETKMRAADVEKAVQRTLFEVETKVRRQL